MRPDASVGAVSPVASDRCSRRLSAHARIAASADSPRRAAYASIARLSSSGIGTAWVIGAPPVPALYHANQPGYSENAGPWPDSREQFALPRGRGGEGGAA